jgi:hypothetical protein
MKRRRPDVFAYDRARPGAARTGQRRKKETAARKKKALDAFVKTALGPYDHVGPAGD